MDNFNRVSPEKRGEMQPDFSSLEYKNTENKRKLVVSEQDQCIKFADSPIKAKKITNSETETDLASDELANILTNVATIMDGNLKNLENELVVFIINNLEHHLDLDIKNITIALDNENFIDKKANINTLKLVKDNLDEITAIVKNHILVSKAINDLIKDNLQKQAIVTEIIKVASVYKYLKQSLQTVFTDLSKVIQESIKVIETKYDAKESDVVNSYFLLREIFNVSSFFDNKVIAISRRTRNHKQLDALVGSYKEQKTVSSSKATDKVSINDFLEQTKDIAYDILPNIILMLQSLNRKTDLLCNACLI